MEQATETLGVRIYGVDGRRLSLPNSTNEVFLDDDPSEDWSLTTAEKDSWAYRERRRSSLWQQIDSYPSIYSGPASVERSPSGSRSRRGSILSLFQPGKDKDGHDVMYSGGSDPKDSDGENSIDRVQPQAKRSALPARPGSLLSPWVRGKDSQGRNVILWIEYV